MGNCNLIRWCIMKIMTWNIQDGGVIDSFNPAISNIQHILDTIKEIAPDIIAIQEYESEYYKVLVEDGLEKMLYSCTVCEEYADRTLRKRVLIATNKPFEEISRPSDIFRYSRRNWNEIYIPCYELKVLGIDVPLAKTTTINGNIKNNEREKKTFLEALLKKFTEYKSSCKPAVILGDFNLHSEAVFREFLDKFSLCLNEITTQDTTWGRHKFDYIFVNDALLELWDKTKYPPQQTSFSDHKYLYANFIL